MYVYRYHTHSRPADAIYVIYHGTCLYLVQTYIYTRECMQYEFVLYVSFEEAWKSLKGLRATHLFIVACSNKYLGNICTHLLVICSAVPSW